jgi:hypothetical protein
MSNDPRNLLANWRNYRSRLMVKENTDQNQLTPQEIQGEVEEFKKGVGGIITFNTITKTGNNFLFIRGQIKTGENTIEFSFKLDECTVSTQNLALNDESIRVLNQLNGYYNTWVQKWQQNLSA